MMHSPLIRKIRRGISHVFFWLVAHLPRRQLRGVSVLMYHMVSEPGPFAAVSVTEFEKQMGLIASRGYTTIFASEVPEMASNARDTVCVTFDDGYEDNYVNAFPILKRYNIKATIFLITGFVGGNIPTKYNDGLPAIHRDQIEEMVASGLIEFLPHSHTHPRFKFLSGAALAEELLQSRKSVSDIMHQEVHAFAYPKGELNDETVSALVAAGYSAAYSIEPGVVQPQSADPLYLPRNAVDSATTLAEFSVKISGYLPWYLAARRLLLSIVH